MLVCTMHGQYTPLIAGSLEWIFSTFSKKVLQNKYFDSYD